MPRRWHHKAAPVQRLALCPVCRRGVRYLYRRPDGQLARCRESWRGGRKWACQKCHGLTSTHRRREQPRGEQPPQKPEEGSGEQNGKSCSSGQNAEKQFLTSNNRVKIPQQEAQQQDTHPAEHPLVTAIEHLLSIHAHQGLSLSISATATDLFIILSDFCDVWGIDRKTPQWPRSARAIGKLLHHRAGELEQRGIRVAQWRTYGYGRITTVYLAAVECRNCGRGSKHLCWCQYQRYWKQSKRYRHRWVMPGNREAGQFVPRDLEAPLSRRKPSGRTLQHS